MACFIFCVMFLINNCFQNSGEEFSFVLHNRADGVMRTMSTEKLLKTVPIIQNQMDALLDFNVSLAACACLNILLTLLYKHAQACKIGQD